MRILIFRGTSLARKAALGLAGIFGFFLVAAVAALIWLRTPSAEAFLAGLLTRALSEQGYTLGMGVFEGPLPGRLHARDITVADKDGPLARARELEAEIALGALLGGSVEVSLRLSGPELLRLPAAAPEKEPESAAPPSLALPDLALPVDIRLTSLRLEDCRIPPAAVLGGPPPPLPPELGPFPGMITADIDGSASLIKGYLRAELNLSLSTDAGQTLAVRTGLKAQGKKAALLLTGGFALPVAGKPLETKYSLVAQLEGPLLTLAQLEVNGAGLDLGLAGSFQSDSGKAQARLALTAADHALWQDALAKLAGFTPDQAFGGGLSLAADTRLEGLPVFGPAAPGTTESLPRIFGNLSMKGADMRWPFPQGAGLLGSGLSLAAAVSGGGDTPWTLTLKEAAAGQVSLTGEASYAATSPGGLTARFNLDIGDLAPLRAGVSGAASARFSVQGPLAALKADAEFSSPALKLAAGTLARPAARLRATYRQAASGDMAAQGDLTASAEQSPAGPIQFSTSWNAALAASGEISAGVRDVRARLAGVDLAGGVKAHIPPAPAGASGNAAPMPELSGGITLEVTDWSGLAALSGAPLLGGPLKAAVNLDYTAAEGQSAALSLNLDSFSLAGQGVALRDLTTNLRAGRLWTSPSLGAALRMGPGEAGPLRWSAGEASLEGARTGAFSLDLRADGSAPGPDAPARKTADSARKAARDKKAATGKNAVPAAKKNKTPPTEKNTALALAGTYDLSRREIILSRLSLNDPGRKAGLRLAAPLTVNLAQGPRVTGLDMAFTPGGRLTAEADLRPGSMRLNAKLTALPLAFFRLFVEDALPEGSIDADVSYAAAPSGPKGSVALRARLASLAADSPGPAAARAQTAAGSSGTTPSSGATASAGATASPGAASSPEALSSKAPGLDLKLDAALERGAGLRLRGEGSLALDGSAPGNQGKLRFSLPLIPGADGTPLPDFKAPLTASFALDSPTAPLWRLAPLPGRTLDGRLAVNMEVTGTLAAPAVTGTAYLAGGRYEDKLLGVLLTDMDLEAHVNPKGGRLVLAAKDGQGGSLALEGDLNPGAAEALNLRGQIRHLRPLRRDDLSVMLSGLFSARGSLASPHVAANILVERGELTLLSSMGGGGVTTLDISESGQEMPKAAAGPTCDLRIDIPRRFFIRGKGLDSEWQGGLAIAGHLSAPSLTGSLRPVRGTLDLLSKTFAFTGGDIVFAGGGRINPGVNLELTYEGPDIVAVVNVSGSAQKPALNLTSRPPLARDEVLAHVLFGKDLSELSRYEALQLANSLRELASGGGEGGFSPFTAVRKGLGLDVLRVGGGDTAKENRTDPNSTANIPGAPAQQKGGSENNAAAGPSLEAGKYINDSIYVGVEQGMSQESTGVRVEIELAPNLNLQGKTSPTSSQVGVGWKMDY